MDSLRQPLFPAEEGQEGGGPKQSMLGGSPGTGDHCNLLGALKGDLQLPLQDIVYCITSPGWRGPNEGEGAAVAAGCPVSAHQERCRGDADGGKREYDYVSFQSDIGAYQRGRFYTKPPQCVDIPADLRLCHNVGYKRMVLPNLLEHESMAEVKQQASSWVPLLNKNCHLGTQVFLCALFAPVCLDRPIYPCRWLCEAVRDSCEPVMQFFGFHWPEMLKCDKFPEGDVCIAMTPPNATEASRPQGMTVCPPCDNELKSEAIIEHLCASEFALRMKIKEVKKENGDKKIVPKKKKPLKLGPIKKKELKRLVLFLKNGADCPCHQLDNLSPHFLIMGRKVKGQYLLTAIHKWDKKNKEFKNFMKKMKNHECPTFQSVFK
ncbi:Secreted frizzled-related protein 1 [Fukomys damarensis]|uniref:Secreted frizzled-related protein 1 n=1 Tax=Fukomys damarensis TaxID=885580 RepID=A0A091DWB3_FUKDA|nr:Secreted frizzled-related protein 1 [Fukomys damarensis]